MKTRLSLLRSSLASLCLSLCAAAGAQAQTPTTISSLPYTITTGGTYVLMTNLSSGATSGNLITVSASNVTINLQDFHLACTGGAGVSTVGICATGENNVTVENGTISGCLVGIQLLGPSDMTTTNIGNRVVNMRVANCYLYGMDIEYATACNVTGCQVSSIGGSTDDTVAGINVTSVGNTTVLAAGTTVQNCSVSNVGIAPSTSAVGIFLDSGCFARQCQVYNAMYGISLGFYQDNLVSTSSQAAFSSGTDGGGNVTDGTNGSDGIKAVSGARLTRRVFAK